MQRLAVYGLACSLFVLIGTAGRELAAVQLDPGNVVAWTGEPFGVGRITIAPPRPLPDPGFDREAFELREANGRIFYPVFSTGPILRFVRNLLGRDNYRPGDTVQIWFLFRGDAPLELTLNAYQVESLRVTPQSRPNLHQRELQRWWDAYVQHAKQRVEASDYPPLIETYLTNMLAQRLGKPDPDLVHAPRDNSGQGALSLLLAPESLHLETLERTMRGNSDGKSPASEPLPANIAWEDSTPATPPPDPSVKDQTGSSEPLALHVPQECFYIRFGSFENFRWFRQTLERHGGDLARVVTLRAHDQRTHARLETQLAVKEGALAAILGGQVISDVALIGRDLFMQDGAALGILFETRLPLLAQDIQRQRRAALDAMKADGAEERQIELAGQKVSFIATPDNRLRSFYVQDGRYHLVTNSQWIAEHFLQAGQGKAALGQSAEFLAMRQVHPPETPDTAWVYLSRYFLEGLFSPQYQIELHRRLTAIAEMELQLLATTVANHEKLPQVDIASLQQARLLPAGFGQRGDGSHVIPEATTWRDSLRGRRGTFLPIPDTPVEHVTPAEATRYASMANTLQQTWRRMDPVMVAIRREQDAAHATHDSLRLRIRMLPFQRNKFMPWVDMLGAPSTVQLQSPADDLLFAEIVLKPDNPNQNPEGQHIFLGVKDAPPHREVPAGTLLLALRMFREIPAYVGAWPEPGILERLPWVRRARTDPSGVAQLPSGLFRYQAPSDITLISFHRELMEVTARDIQPVSPVEPAQFRFRAGNLSESALRGWTQSQEYDRAFRASLGNVHLLHTVSQQFDIPRHQAPDLVQQLLNVTLICPLNGKYELRSNQAGLEYWASTAWSHPRDQYQPPLLGWFRGAQGYVTVLGEHVDGEVRLLVEEPKE